MVMFDASKIFARVLPKYRPLQIIREKYELTSQSYFFLKRGFSKVHVRW